MQITVLTHGYTAGGGVPAVTTWLAAGLLSMGHTVEVHDLSTSSPDPLSRTAPIRQILAHPPRMAFTCQQRVATSSTGTGDLRLPEFRPVAIDRDRG